MRPLFIYVHPRNRKMLMKYCKIKEHFISLNLQDLYSDHVQKFGSLFSEHILLYTYNNKDMERGKRCSLYILAFYGSSRRS